MTIGGKSAIPVQSDRSIVPAADHTLTCCHRDKNRSNEGTGRWGRGRERGRKRERERERTGTLIGIRQWWQVDICVCVCVDGCVWWDKCFLSQWPAVALMFVTEPYFSDPDMRLDDANKSQQKEEEDFSTRKLALNHSLPYTRVHREKHLAHRDTEDVGPLLPPASVRPHLHIYTTAKSQKTHLNLVMKLLPRCGKYKFSPWCGRPSSPSLPHWSLHYSLSVPIDRRAFI